MQAALNLTLITFSMFFTGCILHNPHLNKNTPAQQENINPSITLVTFEEADVNEDGKLDKKEAALANKIEESQNSKWPEHLTAFIAIISAVVAVCVVCMVIAGFRGKPKEDKEDTTNTGFGNFFGLKEGKEEKEEEPERVPGSADGDLRPEGIEDLFNRPGAKPVDSDGPTGKTTEVKE